MKYSLFACTLAISLASLLGIKWVSHLLSVAWIEPMPVAYCWECNLKPISSSGPEDCSPKKFRSEVMEWYGLWTNFSCFEGMSRMENELLQTFLNCIFHFNLSLLSFLLSNYPSSFSSNYFFFFFPFFFPFFLSFLRFCLFVCVYNYSLFSCISLYSASGGGSVGISVASNTRYPRFKSKHRQSFINQL